MLLNGTPSKQNPCNPSATTASRGGVIFYGDPHGVWEPLLAVCAEAPPDGVVLLGDCELTQPLKQQIAPIFNAGVPMLWIAGNHDAHSPDAYDRLWGDHPEGNLHGRAAHCGGLAVAGLGGVFKGKVWYPRDRAAVPVHRSRAENLAQLRRGDRWRGGLPLRHRDTLYPEDLEVLARVRANVLVTHEAPSCHRHGFIGIDQAAHACGAQLIVHGHHHRSYEDAVGSGIWVRGLAQAEVLRLRPEDVL